MRAAIEGADAALWRPAGDGACPSRAEPARGAGAAAGGEWVERMRREDERLRAAVAAADRAAFVASQAGPASASEALEALHLSQRRAAAPATP